MRLRFHSGRLRRASALLCGTGFLLMFVGFGLGSVSTAAAGPAKSNNGDVKVQDAGDPNFPPENDPHVDCPFDLVFYNFDANQHLSATLEGQHPSGDNEQLVWGPTGVTTDGTGFARVHIQAGDLNLTGLTSHPENGAIDLDDKHAATHDSDEATFHLKLDVQTDAGDHLFKHKVFWVGECATGSTTTTTSTSSTTVETQGSTLPRTSTSTTSTSTTSTTFEVSGSTTVPSTATTTSTVETQGSTESTSTTSTTVARPRTTTSTTAVATLGSTLAKTTTTAGPAAVSPSSAAHGSLPFTGSHTNLIGWIGVAVTLAGLVLVQGGRRRPHRGTGA